MQSIEEVFVLSDRYDFDRLKLFSESRLIDTISVENAAALLQLADLHSAAKLRHIDSQIYVFGSSGWVGW